jgi:hypothetical protein
VTHSPDYIQGYRDACNEIEAAVRAARLKLRDEVRAERETGLLHGRIHSEPGPSRPAVSVKAPEPSNPRRPYSWELVDGKECHCSRCFVRNPDAPFSQPMFLCPKCGNKRCPKVEWHGYQCSGSNDLEQVPMLEPEPAAERAIMVGSTWRSNMTGNVRTIVDVSKLGGFAWFRDGDGNSGWHPDELRRAHTHVSDPPAAEPAKESK